MITRKSVPERSERRAVILPRVNHGSTRADGIMDRREALSLAKLISEAAPWAESIYALPVRPGEQTFPQGPYIIFLSSTYLCVEVTSLQEWLEMLEQLQ